MQDARLGWGLNPLHRNSQYILLSPLTGQEKTVRTAIKQDLSPESNPLNYGIWGVLETKQIPLPIPILVRLGLILWRYGTKCLKKFFWKSFRRCVDTIMEKWWPYSVNSLLCVYLFLRLFYHIVVRYIFLILLLYPVWMTRHCCLSTRDFLPCLYPLTKGVVYCLAPEAP